MDNAASFRSELMKELSVKWSIKLTYRCANRPSGNGIVERHHRTIKRMAARSKTDPRDVLFWYNVAPREKLSAPANILHQYSWRFTKRSVESEVTRNRFEIGQSVLVKPFPMHCTSIWKPGVITDINSSTNVVVDGMPRHVSDLRPEVPRLGDSEAVETSSSDGDTDHAEESSPTRRVRRPAYLEDYDTNVY